MPNGFCSDDVDEDCLYLNVYSPIGADNTSTPVVIFIFGGGFMMGSGMVEVYYGQNFVNLTNSVLVTFNYRVGAFGFVCGEEGSNLTCNTGLYDQIAVIQWVQANIGQFGGYSGSVTLMGESAGAMSIGLLMLSPLIQANVHYHRVIMESNPLGLTYKSLAAAQKVGRKFAIEADCAPTDESCLQNLTPEQVMTAASDTFVILWGHLLEMALTFSPAIDGVTVTAQPFNAWQQSGPQIPDIPILLGYNENEGNMFVSEVSKSPNYVEFEAFAVAEFGVDVGPVNSYYSPSLLGNDFLPFANLVGDFIFVCANQYFVNNTLPGRQSGTFMYHFNHIPSNGENYGPYADVCAGYVCHGAELPFVFNSASFIDDSANSDEMQLSLNMVQYWGNFIHTGDPNNPGANGIVRGREGYSLPQWDQADASMSQLLLQTDTDGGIQMETLFDSGICPFYDGVYPNFG